MGKSSGKTAGRAASASLDLRGHSNEHALHPIDFTCRSDSRAQTIVYEVSQKLDLADGAEPRLDAT